MSLVQGYCDSRFGKVKELMQTFIEQGKELGASIAVDIDGESVVDIWGGYVDEAQTESLAVLMLVDRGLIDVDENVSKYWPEFAANGKENVKVRHILSHSSGLSGWEEMVAVEDLYDFERMSSLLAAQATWWEPGTASGYHAQNIGFLLGELVRRVTGKTLKQFVAEEIAAPLEADLQIGAMEKDWPRISEIVPAPGIRAFDAADPDSIAFKTLANPAVHPSDTATAGWRRAEIGAVNGHANARSLARVLSAVSLGGEVNCKRLLSKDTVDLIFQEQTYGRDLVLGATLRFGIGCAITGPDTMPEWLPEGRICYWVGWGGSLGIMDLDRKMTIAYAMNKMGSDIMGNDRSKEYVKAIYAAVEGVKRGRSWGVGLNTSAGRYQARCLPSYLPITFGAG